MYWLYWESKNGKIPENVYTLIQIFKTKLKNLTIINDKTIYDYIDVVSTKNLKHIAQKVDYYRANILFTYGGIQIDIDYLYDRLLQ